MSTSIKFFTLLFALLLGYPGTSLAQNTYWGPQGSAGQMGSVDYLFSIPTADTHDFVPEVSFLGFSMEGYRKTTEQFGVGLSASWVYFSDEQDGTFQINSATVTGKRFSSVDAFPILFMGRFIPAVKKKVTPFVGGGLGPMYGMRRGNIGVFGLDDSGWQFALAGEAGVAVFRHGGGGLKLAARYVGGFGNDSIAGISYLSFSIGLMSAL